MKVASVEEDCTGEEREKKVVGRVFHSGRHHHHHHQHKAVCCYFLVVVVSWLVVHRILILSVVYVIFKMYLGRSHCVKIIDLYFIYSIFLLVVI